METEACAGTRVICTTLQAARANMGARARRRDRDRRCAAPHAADACAGRLHGNRAWPRAAYPPLPTLSYPTLACLKHMPQCWLSLCVRLMLR